MLFTLFVALVPLIVIATRDTIQTQQALLKGAETSLRTGAVQTANSLDTFIQSTMDSISAEAELTDFANFLSASQTEQADTVARKDILDILNILGKKDKLNIISYALVSENGNVLLDSATDRQYNESNEAYFSQVRFSNKPIVTAVTYSENQTPSITFASNIRDANGNFAGILRAKYKATVLQDVILKSVGPSTDASVLLLDQLNIRMADSQNPELILKSIVPLELVDYLVAVDTHRFLDIPREEQATNYLDLELALDNAGLSTFFQG